MGWVGSQVNSFFLRFKKLRFWWGIFDLGKQILTCFTMSNFRVSCVVVGLKCFKPN